MPGSSATRPVRFGLAAKIFFASTLLVVAVLGASFGITALSATRTADAGVARALAGTRSAVANLLAARTRTLAGLSAVSAGVPQFRERLLTSRERANILDQAQEYRDLIGAAWVLVTNEAGILLARTDYPDQFDRDLSSGALVAAALSGDQASGAWLDDVTGRLYEAVATPLAPSRQAAPQGVLVAAYAMDDSVAQAIKQATTSDVVLFALDTIGRPYVVGSTLAREEVSPCPTTRSSRPWRRTPSPCASRPTWRASTSWAWPRRFAPRPVTCTEASWRSARATPSWPPSGRCAAPCCSRSS